MRPRLMVASLVLGLGLLGAACGEEATPVGDLGPSQPATVSTLPGTASGNGAAASTTLQMTPHLLQATEQMKQLARQQCLDHPEKVQGVVNAVDPGRPGQILATATVDCAAVRAGGSGEIDSTTSSTSPPAAPAPSARS